MCTRSLGVGLSLGLLSVGALAQTHVKLPASFRDFRAVTAVAVPPALPAGHPDFERTFPSTTTGQITKGLLAPNLGPDTRPLLGSMVDGGLLGPLSAETFFQWYRPSPRSTQLNDWLVLREVPKASGNYVFRSTAFFPVTGRGYDDRASASFNENFHFTTELRGFFVYQGNEVFYFEGDDDVWVFVNGWLAVDVGGAHPASAARVELAPFFASLPAAQRCVVGQRCRLDMFHAERHTTFSNFTVSTTIRFDDQDDDADGVPNYADNCLTVSNAAQVDRDGDAIGDACDNCPSVTNAQQLDLNRDDAGDACEGVLDAPAPTIDHPSAQEQTDGQPVVSGHTTPDTQVLVLLDDAELCVTTSSSTGDFSCGVPSAMGRGPHSASARVIEVDGGITHLGTESGTSNFLVVTPSPAAPHVSAPPNGSAQGPWPTYEGSAEAGATVELSIDGGIVCTTVADTRGAFQCESDPTKPLSPGAQRVTATARVDTQTSPPSAPSSFVVDVMAPAVPVMTTPAAGSSTTSSPTYSGSGELSSIIIVSVDGRVVCTSVAVLPSGSWSCRGAERSPLAPGAHVATAIASDSVGNTSARSADRLFTVTGPPAEPLITSPRTGALLSTTAPAVEGSAEAGAQEVRVFVDRDPYCIATVELSTWRCTPPAGYRALSDGAHVLDAQAVNAQGASALSSSVSIVIDATAPSPPVVTSPSEGSTVGGSPLIQGLAEPGARVSFRVNGEALHELVVDNSGAFAFTPEPRLGNGDFVLVAVATDEVGNVSEPSSAVQFRVERDLDVLRFGTQCSCGTSVGPGVVFSLLAWLASAGVARRRRRAPR